MKRTCETQKHAHQAIHLSGQYQNGPALRKPDATLTSILPNLQYWINDLVRLKLWNAPCLDTTIKKSKIQNPKSKIQNPKSKTYLLPLLFALIGQAQQLSSDARNAFVSSHG